MKISCLIFLFAISSISIAQMGEKPCPRNQPVISYHEQENAIFLFGGFCSLDKNKLNDLWKYDGQGWVRITNDNPPPVRSGHSMVYDSFNNRLLVFGGKNEKGDLLNDLWSWDGSDWEMLSTDGPRPRQSQRMVINSNNGDIFMFGGSNTEGKALNDTWVFRNGTWIEIESENVPPARLQHTMSYDSKRNRVVLFGGFERTEKGKHIFGDTWEWQSTEGWILRENSDRMARDHHAMTYDLKTEGTILFGGYKDGYLGDTWHWNGEKWQELKITGPSARAGKPGLIFDSNNGVVILFGGWDKSNEPLMDLWQIDAQQLWRKY
ncbi:MAG: kelch repeat-containing protein [Bacteroidota bacterium]